MLSENFLRDFFSMGKNPTPIEPWEVMQTIAAQWMKNDKAAQQKWVQTYKDAKGRKCQVTVEVQIL